MIMLNQVVMDYFFLNNHIIYKTKMCTAPQVECSPLCHIGWYRNGTYIKNNTGLYNIYTQVVNVYFVQIRKF